MATCVCGVPAVCSRTVDGSVFPLCQACENALRAILMGKRGQNSSYAAEVMAELDGDSRTISATGGEHSPPAPTGPTTEVNRAGLAARIRQKMAQNTQVPTVHQQPVAHQPMGNEQPVPVESQEDARRKPPSM